MNKNRIYSITKKGERYDVFNFGLIFLKKQTVIITIITSNNFNNIILWYFFIGEFVYACRFPHISRIKNTAFHLRISSLYDTYTHTTYQMIQNSRADNIPHSRRYNESRKAVMLSDAFQLCPMLLLCYILLLQGCALLFCLSLYFLLLTRVCDLLSTSMLKSLKMCAFLYLSIAIRYFPLH